jgi:hypothetical protein
MHKTLNNNTTTTATTTPLLTTIINIGLRLVVDEDIGVIDVAAPMEEFMLRVEGIVSAIKQNRSGDC